MADGNGGSEEIRRAGDFIDLRNWTSHEAKWTWQSRAFPRRRHLLPRPLRADWRAPAQAPATPVRTSPLQIQFSVRDARKINLQKKKTIQTSNGVGGEILLNSQSTFQGRSRETKNEPDFWDRASPRVYWIICRAVWSCFCCCCRCESSRPLPP